MNRFNRIVCLAVMLLFFISNVNASSSTTGGLVVDWISGNGANLTGILKNVSAGSNVTLIWSGCPNACVAQINAAGGGGGGVSGSGTTNELPYWSSSTGLGALTTGTYPSLTELSYVKGVTSVIQTQINGKSPSAGSSSITTVGTISSGTWSATDIAVASGGTGASDAATARSNLNTVAIKNVKDYGAVCDGITDDTTAINNAISSGSNVYIPGTCSITSTIFIGDGTEAAISTINRVNLFGNSIGGVSDAEIIDSAKCTSNLIWNGASGGTMLRIRGSTFGNAIQGICFNANGLAATAINVTHSYQSKFSNIHIQNYIGIAIDISAYDNPQGGVVTGGNQNEWTQIITMDPVGTAAGGMRIGSSTMAESPYLAVSQATYSNMILTRSAYLTAPASLTLRFTDASVFDNVVMAAHGGSSTGKALEIIPPTGSGSAVDFPESITLRDSPMMGSVNVTGTWMPRQNITLLPLMTGDFNPFSTQQFPSCVDISCMNMLVPYFQMIIDTGLIIGFSNN